MFCIPRIPIFKQVKCTISNEVLRDKSCYVVRNANVNVVVSYKHIQYDLSRARLVIQSFRFNCISHVFLDATRILVWYKKLFSNPVR